MLYTYVLCCSLSGVSPFPATRSIYLPGSASRDMVACGTAYIPLEDPRILLT